LRSKKPPPPPEFPLSLPVVTPIPPSSYAANSSNVVSRADTGTKVDLLGRIMTNSVSDQQVKEIVSDNNGNQCPNCTLLQKEVNRLKKHIQEML
jgi:hypothetical protein